MKAESVAPKASTKANSPPDINSGQQGVYFLAKCFGMFLYYMLLVQLGLAENFHFKCGLFMTVTPIVKFFYMYDRCATREQTVLFGMSVMIDSIRAITWYTWLLPTFKGSTYFFLLVIVAVKLVVLEYAQHILLLLLLPQRAQDARGRYEIKVADNISDLLVIPILGTCMVFYGYNLDFSKPFDVWTFPIYVLALALVDWCFGVTHAFEHVHGTNAFKKHMIHHRYRQEDLCAFANFYSDFLDGLGMNITITGSLFVVCFFFNQTHFILSDVVATAFMSHHKFNEHLFGSIVFFEYEVVDVIFGKGRLSTYHNMHHTYFTSFFTVFGVVSDASVKGVVKLANMHI